MNVRKESQLKIHETSGNIKIQEEPIKYWLNYSAKQR
jgi:hypothetical protein